MRRRVEGCQKIYCLKGEVEERPSRPHHESPHSHLDGPLLRRQQRVQVQGIVLRRREADHGLRLGKVAVPAELGRGTLTLENICVGMDDASVNECTV